MIRQKFFDKVDKSGTINEIMAIEGELWQRFYSNFKYILPEDFTMNKRVKRPPIIQLAEFLLAIHYYIQN